MQEVAGLTGLSFRGLLSHAGQAYNVASLEELGDVAAKEIAILRTLAAAARAASVEVAEISVGSTPTARFITIQDGVTEMRPGQLRVLRSHAVRPAVGDAGELRHVDRLHRRQPACAGTRGVRRRQQDADLGRRARHSAPRPATGSCYTDLESTVPDPSITIERLSEEHSVARVLPTSRLKPGDRVRIIPNHACTVTNLANRPAARRRVAGAGTDPGRRARQKLLEQSSVPSTFAIVPVVLVVPDRFC